MAISKVKFLDDNNDQLKISDIIPPEINPKKRDSTTIFAATTNNGAQPNPRILKIRTMYTSTGRDYIIVNGGIGDEDTKVGNQFWALQFNKDTGYICKNDSEKTELEDKFTQDLLADYLITNNKNSIKIGNNDAPWPAEYKTSDMEVVGDTVYVSLASEKIYIQKYRHQQPYLRRMA